MPSGVPNEEVEQEEVQKYCRFCWQPVVRIPGAKFAGRGELKPYKHSYSSSKINTEKCHRTQLAEDEVTETNLWR